MHLYETILSTASERLACRRCDSGWGQSGRVRGLDQRICAARERRFGAGHDLGIKLGLCLAPVSEPRSWAGAWPVGDWIIYYEPRKVAATRGYFGVAKVTEVIPDPKASGMYLALIEPGSYLDFINPVQFSGTEGVIESGVLNEEGRISGRAQSAVRPIWSADFNRINYSRSG